MFLLRITVNLHDLTYAKVASNERAKQYMCICYIFQQTYVFFHKTLYLSSFSGIRMDWWSARTNARARGFFSSGYQSLPESFASSTFLRPINAGARSEWKRKGYRERERALRNTRPESNIDAISLIIRGLVFSPRLYYAGAANFVCISSADRG